MNTASSTPPSSRSGAKDNALRAVERFAPKAAVGALGPSLGSGV